MQHLLQVEVDTILLLAVVPTYGHLACFTLNIATPYKATSAFCSHDDLLMVVATVAAQYITAVCTVAVNAAFSSQCSFETKVSVWLAVARGALSVDKI